MIGVVFYLGLLPLRQQLGLTLSFLWQVLAGRTYLKLPHLVQSSLSDHQLIPKAARLMRHKLVHHHGQLSHHVHEISEASHHV